MVVVTQGVASLALGYGLDGLSARPSCVFSRAVGALRSLRRVLGALFVRVFPRGGRFVCVLPRVGSLHVCVVLRVGLWRAFREGEQVKCIHYAYLFSCF